MLKAIKTRRSTRAFLAKAVEARKLNELLCAAMFAPNSWGTMPWEFIIVKDPEIKEKLSKSTAHAHFVKNAPLVIVVIFDTEKGKRFKEDSSIAAAHIMLEAENQGLGSCFVQIADAGEPEGFAEPFVRKLLGVPEKFRVQCMLPVGYPKRKLAAHKESKFDKAKIHEERF